MEARGLLDRSEDELNIYASHLDIKSLSQLAITCRVAFKFFQPLYADRLLSVLLPEVLNSHVDKVGLLLQNGEQFKLDLLLKNIKFIDLTGVSFYCSLFQYGVCSFDIPMLKNMIERFSREQAETALTQMSFVFSEEFAPERIFSLGKLIQKLREYINTFNPAESLNENKKLWVEGYGGILRYAPAALVKIFCATNSEYIENDKYDFMDFLTRKKTIDRQKCNWFPLENNVIGKEIAIVFSEDNRVKPVGYDFCSVSAAQNTLNFLVKLEQQLHLELANIRAKLEAKVCMPSLQLG